MKRLAVFCDGTWNRADAEHATNVVKLAQAMRRTAPDGTAQLATYIQGVGTGRGAGRLSRTIDRVGGGAFGWGLTSNIEEAYRAIAFNYEPGDEIYIFGFSRGAYTARSLGGLIRAAGIIDAQHVAQLGRVIERYRDRDPDTKPDSEESLRERAETAPLVHTSEEEAAWRQSRGIAVGTRLRIAYMGVWDTVGALGVPSKFPGAGLFNRKYRFHDLNLSSSVEAARHAVAIDERRSTFPPTLWQNLDRLNADAAEGKFPYRQLWFPGDHGSVGGGGEICGLSSEAAIWIAEGAAERGLAFDDAALAALKAEVDPFGPLRNSAQPLSLLDRLLRLRALDRTGIGAASDLSPSALLRWYHENKDAAGWPYRPKPLQALTDAIKALGPPGAP